MSDTVTPQPDDPDDPAARIWHNLRVLVLDHERRREVCDALGMSNFRVNALRAIAAGPPTMRRPAERLSSDAPHITVVVDDLERRDLVTRTVTPDDRRSKLVTVTPAGRAAAARAEQILDRPLPE